MTRGDQRERDRAKSQAKQLSKQKAQSKGGNPMQRNQNDAAALAQKVAAKRALKEQAQQNDSKPMPVPRRKSKQNVDSSLDDMLRAGLKGVKKAPAMSSLTNSAPTSAIVEEVESKMENLTVCTPTPGGAGTAGEVSDEGADEGADDS